MTKVTSLKRSKLGENFEKSLAETLRKEEMVHRGIEIKRNSMFTTPSDLEATPEIIIQNETQNECECIPSLKDADLQNTPSEYFREEETLVVYYSRSLQKLEKYKDAIKTVLEYLQKNEISPETKSQLYRVLGECLKADGQEEKAQQSLIMAEKYNFKEKKE